MTTNTKTKNTFKIGQKFNKYETGLTRAVRELVLADGSGVSDYVRAKAQEIEALANPLRGVPEVSAPAGPKKEEGL